MFRKVIGNQLQDPLHEDRSKLIKKKVKTQGCIINSDEVKEVQEPMGNVRNKHDDDGIVNKDTGSYLAAENYHDLLEFLVGVAVIEMYFEF